MRKTYEELIQEEKRAKLEECRKQQQEEGRLEYENRLKTMEIGNRIEYRDLKVDKVPGGWIFSRREKEYNNGGVGLTISSVFVPERG